MELDSFIAMSGRDAKSMTAITYAKSVVCHPNSLL